MNAGLLCESPQSCGRLRYLKRVCHCTVIVSAGSGSWPQLDHARAVLTSTGGRQDFARLHGYPIVATSIVADPSLPMQWNKIGWLLRAYRVRCCNGIGRHNWPTWQ